MLNRQLRPRFGFDLPNATVDIAQRYAKAVRRVNPQMEPSLRFEAMAESLGVPVMGRHTALGDAVTTALMYVRLNKTRRIMA
jgi:DNA polymerase-3 subunit epsilon